MITKDNVNDDDLPITKTNNDINNNDNNNNNNHKNNNNKSNSNNCNINKKDFTKIAHHLGTLNPPLPPVITKKYWNALSDP